MKRHYVPCLVMAVFLGLHEPAFSQHATIGGYTVYYGNLHNHCEFSDGTGTANLAYQTAKTQAGFDFFGLSDHGELLDPAEWNTMRSTADQFNEDHVFTALWGFEWSSVTNGHLTVVGTNSYASSLNLTTSNFNKIIKWIGSANGIAFMNHPGDYDDFNNEFYHFQSQSSPVIVGMELWNGSSGFNHYYYNDGYNTDDGGLGFYDEALHEGWKTGASGAEDNHSATWGSGQYRMAVLAHALTRDSIMSALRARRFYSTMDKNLEMSFQISSHEMGSTLTPGTREGVIRLHDADNEIFTEAKLMVNGLTASTFTLSAQAPVIHFFVEANPSDYCYIVVTQEDGDEAVSSPVFFSDSPVGTDRILEKQEYWYIRYTDNNHAVLVWPGDRPACHMVLTDITGRVALTIEPRPGEAVDLTSTGLPAGVYILHLNNLSVPEYHKVLIR
jgi:hypothetical protein